MDSITNHPEERKNELTQAIPQKKNQKKNQLYLVDKGVLCL